MKRLSMVMLILMLSSFVLTFTSCETDTDDLTGPINTSLPEVTGITASSKTIPAGNTIEVAVTAKNGDSYSWSAEEGEFSSPSSATTNWTSSSSSSVVASLVCTVTNGSGSRSASIFITSVLLTAPVHHWTFDADKSDAIGSANAEGDLVTINTSDAKIGAGCASFPGLEYGADFDPEAVLLVPNDDGINTGAESNYTITVWIKTEEIGYGVWGRTVDGVWDGYAEDVKMWAFYDDYGDQVYRFAQEPWGRTDVEDAGFNDGEWHHYAAIHNESDLYTFYVDGEEIGSGNLLYDGTTNPDLESSVFTLGGGSGWFGVLNGLMDDAKYFNTTLSTAELALLAAQ